MDPKLTSDGMHIQWLVEKVKVLTWMATIGDPLLVSSDLPTGVVPYSVSKLTLASGQLSGFGRDDHFF
jgi:hypothetical protein